MNKYIGRTVDIIYMDRHGQFTKRMIRIHTIKGETVRAYCYERQEARVFRVKDILAVQLVEVRPWGKSLKTMGSGNQVV